METKMKTRCINVIFRIRNNKIVFLDCSEALVIDGHMKGTRSTCDERNETLYCEELGNISIGCKKTPLKGSYYCTEHQPIKIEREKVSVVIIVLER